MFLLNKAHLDVCVRILKSSLESIIEKPLKASSAREIIAKLAGYNTYSGLCDALKNKAVKLDPWLLPDDTFFDVVKFIGKTHKVTIDHGKQGNLRRIEVGLKYALMGKPELDDKNVSESICKGIQNSQVIDNYLYALVDGNVWDDDDYVGDVVLNGWIDLRHAFTDAESKVSVIEDANEFFWHYVDKAEGHPDWENIEDEQVIFQKQKDRLLKEPEVLDKVFEEYAVEVSAADFNFGFWEKFGAAVDVFELSDIPSSIRDLLAQRFGADIQVVTWSFCSFPDNPDETLRELGSSVQETQLYAAILSKGDLIFLGASEVWSVNINGVWNLYEVCDMHSGEMADVHTALGRFALEQGYSDIDDLRDPLGNVHFSLQWEERNILDNNQTVNAWLSYQALASIRCELDRAYEAQTILFPDNDILGDGDRHYVFTQIEQNQPSGMRVVGMSVSREYDHSEEDIERLKLKNKKQIERFEHLRAMTRELDLDGEIVNISYNPWGTDSIVYEPELDD